MIKVGDWIRIVGDAQADKGLKCGDVCKVQALYYARIGEVYPIVEVSNYGWKPNSLKHPHLDREKTYWALADGRWEVVEEPKHRNYQGVRDMVKVGDWIKIVENVYAHTGLKDGDICNVVALDRGSYGTVNPIVEVSSYGWYPSPSFYSYLDREKQYFALMSGGWEVVEKPRADTTDSKRWLVVDDDGDEPHFYTSYEAAKSAAKELCEQNGYRYYVYACKGWFEKGGPVWKE